MGDKFNEFEEWLDSVQKKKINRKEYIKVIQERNKFIKVLQNVFKNILDVIDLYNVENIDFNKMLCQECICKVCFNKDCPGRLCNGEGFKCDWRGKEKEPVFECECFEDGES